MDDEIVDSGHMKKGGLLDRLVAGVADAADAGAKAVNAGAEAIKTGAKKTHQAFGGEYGEVFEGNLVGEDGSYIMPDPALDEREFNEIETLAKRYEKLTSPGTLAKAGKQIGEAVPAPMKALANKAGKAAKDALNGLTEQELMANAIKAAAEGFGELEKQAAKASVSREYVISRINEGKQEQKVSSLSEICLLRAYDVAAVSANERLHHMGIALAEGGGTGAAGFWGLPANLVLSMLIYFRAVQSVAMFYGYDVRDDPSELVIASEVFKSALAPKAKVDASSEYIGKALVYAEAAVVKQTAKKGWSAMVEQGGAALAIAQIRALANGAARKAVENGGKKALEAGVFKKALTQIGQKMTLETVGKMVPVIGAGFGALFDSAQMKRILDFADLFYHKRFIVEKDQRARALAERGPESSVSDSPAEMKEIALAPSPEQGLDSIAARLLEIGLRDGKSFVSSPACLQVALEALARGAEAETLAEIDTVLGDADAREAAHAALFGEPSESLPDNYSFTIGTSIWADPDRAPLHGSYAESISDMNGKAVEANPASEEAHSRMSSWLAENTGGKFTSAPQLDASTTLALMSAMRFKDTWINRLDDEETDMLFHAASSTPTVTMMGGFSFYEDLIREAGGTAVTWHMESGAQAVFAMPDETASIEEFIGSGSAWSLISRCRDRKGVEHPEGGIGLVVPELDLKTEGMSLDSAMKAMGVRRLFSPEAQLGSLTEADTMLDRAIQSSMLKLDPNGAEGAAFTLFACRAGALPMDPPEPVRLVFNRPFVFALFNDADAPLFVGAYTGE